MCIRDSVPPEVENELQELRKRVKVCEWREEIFASALQEGKRQYQSSTLNDKLESRCYRGRLASEIGHISTAITQMCLWSGSAALLCTWSPHQYADGAATTSWTEPSYQATGFGRPEFVRLASEEAFFLAMKRVCDQIQIRSPPAPAPVVGDNYSRNQPAPATATPCLLYTSPSPRDRTRSRMPSSA
eukprot:TRINITY_DN1873_c0_g1_i8.p1 TRINITY_DN1873_c0_g1~~TRINITY_DN1873_c0_g1_i8.p1  ORF type:complete len:187 (+),score=48.91 TRINITY_DN1873_c0_g1_i8:149-709(+)